MANQDPALKAAQAKFPNVDIKAIQDDTTIFGDPEDIFDKTDDGSKVTKLGALSLLFQELKARGLDCNKIKFACAGTTPDACARKPSWLKEPTTIEAADGSIIHARGIDICNNPIGEDLKVQTFVLSTMRIRINVGLHFMLQICHILQIIKALFALSRIDTLNLTQHFISNLRRAESLPPLTLVSATE